MKRFAYLFIIICCVLGQSCQQDDDFEALPKDISSFVCQYWPNPNIESYTHPSADTYVVIVRDGPKLTFGANYAWTEIDGCGLPLPAVLLFNELPEPLYRYISETEATNAVFKIERTPRLYTLTMLDYIITYDPATHAIHTI